MKLQKYDIILTKPTTLKSWIISKLLKQPYNHATWYLGDYHCIESNICGVKIKEFNNRLGQFDVYRLKTPLTEQQEIELEEFLQKQINKPYNYIYAIGSLFNISTNDNNSYVCYSLIAQALKHIGVAIDNNKKAFAKLQDNTLFYKI